MDEEGEIIIEKLEGYISQIFQHETDHLDGKTVAERLLHTLSQNSGTILPIIDNLHAGEEEFEKQYSYFKAGENARIISTHPNNYLSLAYQFHLSGMFPKNIGVSDKQALLFKDVIENYFLQYVSQKNLKLILKCPLEI